MSKVIKVGDLYIDCGYRPLRCVKADRRNDDLEGLSLVDGMGTLRCSFVHCGQRKLSQKDAKKLVAIWKKDGERGAMIYCGWSEKAADEFIRAWRTK